MDYYVNTTPVIINPNSSAYIAPFQPTSFDKMSLKEKALTEQTAFVTAVASSVEFFAASTEALALTSSQIPQTLPTSELTPALTKSEQPQTENAAVPLPNAEIDQIAKQRVRLMAAKYAGGPQSTEILARLEILNSRLLERAPRVSKEQVVALENAHDQLARIRAAREERAKRFGIPTEL